MDKLQELRDKLAAGFGVAGLRQAEEKAERNARANRSRFGKEHPATVAANARYAAARVEAQNAVRQERETKEEIARISAPVATQEELDAETERVRVGWEKIFEMRNALISASQKIADTPAADVVAQSTAFDAVLSLAEAGSNACWDIKAAEIKLAALKRRGVDD